MLICPWISHDAHQLHGRNVPCFTQRLNKKICVAMRFSRQVCLPDFRSLLKMGWGTLLALFSPSPSPPKKLVKNETVPVSTGLCIYQFCHDRPRRWSIFRAMQCPWFIFQQRCDTNHFWEKLNIAIVAIIFLNHREQLFFDYFAHFRTDYFAIIH